MDIGHEEQWYIIDKQNLLSGYLEVLITRREKKNRSSPIERTSETISLQFSNTLWIFSTRFLEMDIGHEEQWYSIDKQKLLSVYLEVLITQREKKTEVRP